MKTICNILYKTALFALALGLSQFSQAFVSYTLLKKGEQTILILGLMHKKFDFNKEWINTFFNCFDNYEKNIFAPKNTIHCLYELTDMGLADPDSICDPVTQRLVDASKKSFNSIKFIHCDVRNVDISYEINELFSSLGEVLAIPFRQDKSNHQQVEFSEIILKNLPEYQRFKKKFESISDLQTIEQYYQNADAEMKKIKEWCEIHPQASTIFQDLYLRYLIAFEQIKKFLAGDNSKLSFINSLITKLENLSWLEASKKWVHITHLLSDEQDCLFADAGFLNQMLSSNQNKIILAVGEAHAINLKKYLIKNNYIQVKDQSLSVCSLHPKYPHITLEGINIGLSQGFGTTFSEILNENIFEVSGTLVSLNADAPSNIDVTTSYISAAAAAAATTQNMCRICKSEQCICIV